MSTTLARCFNQIRNQIFIKAQKSGAARTAFVLSGARRRNLLPQ